MTWQSLLGILRTIERLAHQPLELFGEVIVFFANAFVQLHQVLVTTEFIEYYQPPLINPAIGPLNFVTGVSPFSAENSKCVAPRCCQAGSAKQPSQVGERIMATLNTTRSG
jgi:hypothetical protein